MSDGFSKSLETILRATGARLAPATNVKPPAPPPPTQDATERRQKRFAEFVKERVMPLFEKVVTAAKEHGATASCRLVAVDGRLAAELTFVRGRLPQGAKPPQMTVYATDGEPPVMVEFTGTFPHVGARGGFGAEVDYDSVYPSQVEEKLLEFVALASGAGNPLE